MGKSPSGSRCSLTVCTLVYPDRFSNSSAKGAPTPCMGVYAMPSLACASASAEPGEGGGKDARVSLEYDSKRERLRRVRRETELGCCRDVIGGRFAEAAMGLMAAAICESRGELIWAPPCQ